MRDLTRNRNAGTGSEATPSAFSSLGPLPERLLYYDDYSKVQRELLALRRSDVWILFGDGQSLRFDFGSFLPGLRDLLKHWAIREFARTKATSACACLLGIRAICEQLGPETISRLFQEHPMEIRAFWYARIYREFPQTAARGMKSLMHFCCEMSLGRLNPSLVDFVSRLALPTRDKYAALRSGDVFLTLHEEAALFDYLSDLACTLRRDPNARTLKEVRDASILALALQWGVRPMTIALLREHDVRLSVEPDGTHSAVFTLEAIKRPGETIVETATRSCRPEWAPIVMAYANRRDRSSEQFSVGMAEHSCVPGSFFRASSKMVGRAIAETSGQVLRKSRTATDFRHTGAQRLADAGASLDDLRRYLLHAEDSNTPLVYIDQSPTQASKLNRALALSPIYTAIVEVARTRIIDKSKLPGLAPDHQIGGCPHGIPIAGIGACEIGQSLCSRNPVLSCYACNKFMPVSDVQLHEQVRDSLRGIVVDCFHASLDDATQPPAFAQLNRTIAAVDATIAALNSELKP